MKLHFFSKVDEELIQYIVDASWNDNVLSYYEKHEGQANLVNLIVKNDTIELIRDGDICSKFTFKKGCITQAEYKNLYGNMNFEILTNELVILKNKILIEYTTIFDKNSTTNVKLWFLIKENA